MRGEVKDPTQGVNRANTVEELAFSTLECGVHDSLHIYPLFGIFYFPWHRHQMEGTNDLVSHPKDTECETNLSKFRSRAPTTELAYPPHTHTSEGIHSL